MAQFLILVLFVMLIVALLSVVPVCIIVFLGWKWFFVYILVCMVCSAIRNTK